MKFLFCIHPSSNITCANLSSRAKINIPHKLVEQLISELDFVKIFALIEGKLIIKFVRHSSHHRPYIV